ncbi:MULTISPECIES: hypothetical protein [Arthrobacter]|uniref:Uncharacterized protein n=1 Tax=Arthrobacter terricola TaxID=2547396 RepID=A0A4R5KBB4_9MICC|nr:MULTISPECIES: hypothetical protein [Arthrobacter]MBT8162639.1 hypothetical protein [Arthrobacter sp. GN70]TDF92421.1 hypothetical protein E1809_17925 [Arthrobacter terricola]
MTRREGTQPDPGEPRTGTATPTREPYILDAAVDVRFSPDGPSLAVRHDGRVLAGTDCSSTARSDTSWLPKI